MRKPHLLVGAALVAAMLPLFAHAQFQQPTPEELKMTSDPKAPGAAAVYLDIEQTTDDNLHYKSYYARIKVLTEKGKSLANVEIPYAGEFKVTDIKARTIHSDGTIIPLDVKPENLLSFKDGNTKFGKMVFTLPSVEVGSILEYRYQLRYPDEWVSSPRWKIQRDYFVHKEHYSFIPFASFLKGSQASSSHYLYDEATGQTLNTLIWMSRLPAGTAPLTSDTTGRYTLDLSDIPARPDEEWMPPIDSLLYKVQFYYKGSYNATDFWQDEGKRWSKQVDRFAQPSSNLRQAVASIIAPSDTDLVKAQKIYAAVEALNNTDYSRTRSQSEMQQLKIKPAKRAEDVWTQKGGDSNEIALLCLAMLRAAGLKAYAIKVVDRDQALFDASYLDRDQFNDVLVLFKDGTKMTVLDPGEKLCPFGTVNWRHSNTYGLAQSDQGPVFGKTPDQPYTANSTTRTGNITIDEHGAITGYITQIMSGQQALRWRQMELENDDTAVKKAFDRELQQIVPAGVDAHVDHFLAMGDPSANLIAMINVKGSMGAATGKRMLLPGFFFESRAAEPFVQQEKRLEPIDMHYGDRISDQITYHFPAAMSVEGAPQDAKVSWPKQAIYLSQSKAEPGQITVTRVIIRGFDYLNPSDYQELRGFYQKVAASDQQEVVLHAASPAKGN